MLRKVVKVQTRVRRWLAIKELKRLKVGGGLWVGHWWAELCGWGTGGQNGMKAGSKVVGQPICTYVCMYLYRLKRAPWTTSSVSTKGWRTRSSNCNRN